MADTGSSIPCPWNVDSRFQWLPRFRASYIEQAPAVKKVDNAIHGINLYPVDSGIGPLQLVIPAWYKIAVLESRSRTGTRQTKDIYIILNYNFLCLSWPSATFALQHGGFVPREWLAAKDLLVSLILIHWIEIYPVDNAIHLLNNQVWIPNFKPQNLFRISLQEKNSRVPESGLPYT